MAADEALRAELVARATRPAAPGNADRLWDVLDEYEAWPGFGLVGPDGEHAAWLIAQLGDPELQRRCLEYLEIAVEAGDAPAAHLACLLDRVRMTEGRPQVYGSQWVVTADGALAPWPIAEPHRVDERRRRVGLGPLALQGMLMDVEHTEHGRPDWPRTAAGP